MNRVSGWQSRHRSPLPGRVAGDTRPIRNPRARRSTGILTANSPSPCQPLGWNDRLYP